MIDLVEYASVASKSKSIIYYNLAKISKIQGLTKEMQEHLETAKKLSPKLIEKRIKLEKSFS